MVVVGPHRPRKSNPRQCAKAHQWGQCDRLQNVSSCSHVFFSIVIMTLSYAARPQFVKLPLPTLLPTCPGFLLMAKPQPHPPALDSADLDRHAVIADRLADLVFTEFLRVHPLAPQPLGQKRFNRLADYGQPGQNDVNDYGPEYYVAPAHPLTPPQSP